MKLTILKYKYQIIQQPRYTNKKQPLFAVYKTPYGIFKFFYHREYKNDFLSIQEAEEYINGLIQPEIETKIIKEYLI
jgi:hypothetical protein